MKDKMKQLTKPIEISEIELRIGTVSEKKGFSILAYKNSRVDVKRFNAVFGARWKPKYEYDEKGELKCTIYVYDDEIEEWIGREAVGVESRTEKTKGSYSDALKRAGFRWGVGIELYDMPFFWVNWNDNKPWRKNNKGKFVPKVYLDDWKIVKKNDQYQILDGSGNVMCGKTSHKKKKKKKTKPKAKPEPEAKDNPFKNDPEHEKALAGLREARQNLLGSDIEMGFMEACNYFKDIEVKTADDIKALSIKQINKISAYIHDIIEQSSPDEDEEQEPEQEEKLF